MERDDDLQLTIDELDLVAGGHIPFGWDIRPYLPPPPTQPISGGHTGGGIIHFGWDIRANEAS